MTFYKFKCLASARWQRLIRWEFWPVYLFYIPIVFYILWLAVKYRSATLFSIANPKMEYGGIFGDDKSNTLIPLSEKFPHAVPQTFYFKEIEQSQAILKDNNFYPAVLKPNSGYRGTNVSIVRSVSEAQDYFNQHDYQETIGQEYIEGKEFGVFYIREPSKNQGFIYSIVEKTFPEVTGNGVSTLEQLILNHSRATLMAPTFLKRHHKSLTNVLDNGERLKLVNIGSHCRGSLFLDANHLISKKLEQKLDQLTGAIPDFYFGRLDLRCPSAEALQAGEDLKVLEVNGVTSEAAHMYDPKHSLNYAYKVMFKQWEWAFRIGMQNQQKGNKPIPLISIIKRWLNYNK